MARKGGAPENLAPPWKPGQSGNPGGMSKETAALIRENAERASRIRARILAKLDSDDLDAEMTSELLRMLKDSEDRGYGSPVQPTDNKHSGKFEFTIRFED